MYYAYCATGDFAVAIRLIYVVCGSIIYLSYISMDHAVETPPRPPSPLAIWGYNYILHIFLGSNMRTKPCKAYMICICFLFEKELGLNPLWFFTVGLVARGNIDGGNRCHKMEVWVVLITWLTLLWFTTCHELLSRVWSSVIQKHFEGLCKILQAIESIQFIIWEPIPFPTKCKAAAPHAMCQEFLPEIVLAQALLDKIWHAGTTRNDPFRVWRGISDLFTETHLTKIHEMGAMPIQVIICSFMLGVIK